jgi:hypothetical protein
VCKLKREREREREREKFVFLLFGRFGMRMCIYVVYVYMHGRVCMCER